MSAWAKLYTDILGDPKLMRAARKGAKELELLPWLIVFAKLSDDGGRLTVNGEPAEPVDVAALVPGVTARRVAVALRALTELGVLTRDTDGALRFAAWDHRSGGKPSDTREAIRSRVQAHRERQRQSGDGDTDVTPGNADAVTPGNALQRVTRNATDKEKEREREEEGEKEREELLSATPPTTRRARGSKAGPAKPKADRPAPSYPHYPKAACDALYEVWLERRGRIDYARFRKETASLFPSETPPYALEELLGALKLCFAVAQHQARAWGRGYEWQTLTPAAWVARIVEHVRDYRQTQADPEYMDRLLPMPAPHARSA